MAIEGTARQLVMFVETDGEGLATLYSTSDGEIMTDLSRSSESCTGGTEMQAHTAGLMRSQPPETGSGSTVVSLIRSTLKVKSDS